MIGTDISTIFAADLKTTTMDLLPAADSTMRVFSNKPSGRDRHLLVGAAQILKKAVPSLLTTSGSARDCLRSDVHQTVGILDWESV
jgi:hypothetical protein